MRRRNLFQERYDRFLTELKNEILSGGLKPGEFILPENTLSEKYKISRVSVRKVLAQFVEEGLIEKIAGKGNRVKFPDPEMARQTVSLTWFSNSYEHDIVHTIIERYEASHPYVKIDLHILPAENYVDMLADMMQQGTGPDLCFLSDVHFRYLIDCGKLDLLSPYMPTDFDIEPTSYRKLFDMFRVNDTQYSIPIHFSPIVMCYNKDMFEQAGIVNDNPLETWEDLLKVAKRNTSDANAEGMIDQYGFCFSSSINRWPAFIVQNGGAFRTKDGSRSVFADERNAEALQFCHDLMYKHRVSPIYSHASSYLAESMFKKKRCAMMLTTYYFMNEFRHSNLRWDVLPVPRQRERGTLLLSGSLGISAGSDKVKVAQSFVDFFIGEEAQTILKQNGCTVPMRRDVAEDDRLLDPDIHPPHYNTFIDSLMFSYSHRELGITTEDGAILNDELETLWANMDPPEAVCRRVEDRVNESIRIRLETSG